MPSNTEKTKWPITEKSSRVWAPASYSLAHGLLLLMLSIGLSIYIVVTLVLGTTGLVAVYAPRTRLCALREPNSNRAARTVRVDDLSLLHDDDASATREARCYLAHVRHQRAPLVKSRFCRDEPGDLGRADRLAGTSNSQKTKNRGSDRSLHAPTARSRGFCARHRNPRAMLTPGTRIPQTSRAWTSLSGVRSGARRVAG